MCARLWPPRVCLLQIETAGSGGERRTGGQQGQRGHTPHHVHLGREGPERQGSAEGAPPPDREGSGKRDVSGLQRCAFHRCKRVSGRPWRESTCRVRILRGEKRAQRGEDTFRPLRGPRGLFLSSLSVSFLARRFVLFCFSWPPLSAVGARRGGTTPVNAASRAAAPRSAGPGRLADAEPFPP